jgi:flagellar biosynthetic protein FliR
MFEIYNFTQPEILSFILVLIRISAFVVAMPLIGTEQVPPHLKVLFALVLAMLIYPSVKWQQTLGAGVESDFIWLTMKEVLIGIILGYISRLFFFALMIAGEFISISSGRHLSLPCPL